MAVTSLYSMAEAAGGIYSTITGAGTAYDKAEAFAHDVILLVLSAMFFKGALTALTESVSLCRSAARELVGRKTRLRPSEVITESRSSKYIADYDDLLTFAEEYLDGDGIQFLRNTMTENGNRSDVSELRKVARVLEQGKEKIGRGLTKEEIQAGLDALWNDGGVEDALAAVERCWQRKISIQTISNKFPNDNQTGKIFSHTLENGKIKLENGVHEVDFVVDMDGNLRLGSGHSYLADGNSVQAAGKMKVNSQGNVRLITNESGHYQPNVEQALNYPDILQKAGLNLDKSWILVKIFKSSSSNYVTDSEVLYNGPIKYMPK